MKWFSMDWAFGGLSDDQWQAISADYEQQVSDLLPALNGDLREFVAAGAMGNGLHDASVSGLTIDVKLGTVTLVAESSNPEDGAIVVVWSNADLLDRTADVRRALATAGTKIVYVETERTGEERFRMGLLFWPSGEMNVQFSSFSLEHTDKP